MAVDSNSHPRVNVAGLRGPNPELNNAAFLDMDMDGFENGKVPAWFQDSFVLIGTATITIELRPHADLVADKVQGMREKLRELRTSNANAEMAMLTEINKLLAITNEAEPADPLGE
jgi:hypothetical protein